MQDDGDDAEDDDPEESVILASQREQERHDNEWIASETQALESFKRQRISSVTDLMRKRRAIWEKRAWTQKAARAGNDRIKLESRFELLRGRYEGIQLDPRKTPEGQRLHERYAHDRTPDENPARDRDGREEDEGTERGGESRNWTAEGSSRHWRNTGFLITDNAAFFDGEGFVDNLRDIFRNLDCNPGVCSPELPHGWWVADSRDFASANQVHAIFQP